MSHPSLIAPVTPAKKFTWVKNTGVCEASDLGFRAGQLPGYRLYEDACDFGFRVMGKFKEILFLFDQDVYSPDGTEISGWVYTSWPAGFTLEIFND
jgi:hypothetical protein